MAPVVQLPTILLTIVGDSVYALTNADGNNAWSQTTIANLAAQYTNHSFALENVAAGGTTSPQHLVQAQSSIANTPAKLQFKFALYCPWSPNDGGTASVITSTFNTYQPQLLALCQAAGFIPIIGTGCPHTVITTCPDDTARVNMNNAIRALATGGATPILVADFDAAVTAGGCQAVWQTQYSDNDAHPDTAAGQAIMAATLENAIATYLTSIGVT
jgi:hypothetical protein